MIKILDIKGGLITTYSLKDHFIDYRPNLMYSIMKKSNKNEDLFISSFHITSIKIEE